MFTRSSLTHLGPVQRHSFPTLQKWSAMFVIGLNLFRPVITTLPKVYTSHQHWQTLCEAALGISHKYPNLVGFSHNVCTRLVGGLNLGQGWNYWISNLVQGLNLYQTLQISTTTLVRNFSVVTPLKPFGAGIWTKNMEGSVLKHIMLENFFARDIFKTRSSHIFSVQSRPERF